MSKWEKRKLGGLTNIKTGKLDVNAGNENGKYPFFTCAKDPYRISSYSYDCECVLVAGNGDLNVKYYNGKFDAYQRTYIIESKDKSKLNVQYMFHFLSQYVKILRNQAIGGVIKYIKIGNLTEATIPLPPLETQKQIAKALDAASELLAMRRQQLAELNNLNKSIFYDMFGDPVTNEKGWDIKKLSEIGTIDRGVSKHRPRNDPSLLGGQYPLIQTGDVSNADFIIQEYKKTYSDKGLSQSRIWKAGTLCITIAANIAKTAIMGFNACFPDSVVGFNANEHTNNIFVLCWFRFFQKILEAQAPESAQKNINLRILNELNVILPPIACQNKFASIVTKAEAQKSLVKKSIEESQLLFDSLMSQYFD